MNLNELYNREQFISFLEKFLPDYKHDQENIKIDRGYKYIKSIAKLGISDSLDLKIYEVEHSSEKDPRVSISREIFNFLKYYSVTQALVIFKSKRSDNFRLSLITFKITWTEGDKVKTHPSNPRRFSYFLGPDAKVNTPYQFLIKKGQVVDFEDLKSRFSIEVVNKEFYRKISNHFIQLVGGALRIGNKTQEYNALLKLPSVKDQSQISLEFAVRLIGRIIFCWFLREKKSSNGLSLMPKNLLSFEAVKQHKDYYHKILEPIFFEILNKPVSSRKNIYTDDLFSLFSSIPYLNGGLFSPQDDDYFSYSASKQAVFHNTVIIPDEWFQSFFNVLELYNFTIDENTSFDEELSIDPEMLGRIFENLLAEINPETGESARKSTGSYYTPRTIVDYMIDESLFYYLKGTTGISEEKLRAIISYDLTDDSESSLNENEKEKIVTAIENMKILDPACGSGAFPIGALQKIVFILQQIDPDGQLWFKKQIKNTSPEIKRVLDREFANKNFDYIRKLGVIRENIYGIDIQPIATEISRLRCFLTLVVDQRVDDKLENRGIEPLPNLDFKFVTANTLLSLPELNTNQMELFDDVSKIEQLKDIRNQYFNALGEERIRLMMDFSELQTDMVNELIDRHSFTGAQKADLTRKLTDWKPFKHKSTDWFDPEWMFGIKEGFDIVIGNPPYIQLQKAFDKNRKYADLYKNENYETFNRTGDIYTIFYEKGVHLLSQGGILSFITSNKWMRAKYGKNLRAFLSKRNPLILLDLGSGVFTSATVDTNILLIQNNLTNDTNLKAYSTKSNQNINNLDNSDYIRINNLSDESWTILSLDNKSIKEKIESVGIPLAKWNLNINYGIKTGYNEAFIIDKATRQDLIAQDKKNDEIIKPILRGRDIKRYKANFSDLWLINAHNGYTVSQGNKIYRIDVEHDYPSIKGHFDKYYFKLEKRYDQGDTPYNLRNCAYIEEFNKEKIIYQEMVQEPAFLLDSEGKYFCLDTGRIITGENLKYLLAIMNSKLFFYAVKTYYGGGGLGNKGIRMKHTFFEKFPIPTPTKAQQRDIEEIANEVILKKKHLIDTKVEEEQIDQMVYELYGLTTEEIATIEAVTK